MLKKSASVVPCLAEALCAGRSRRSEAQRTGRSTPSPLRSLRPCWTALLTILRTILYQDEILQSC